MAAINWPVDLPETLRIDGLQSQDQDAVIKTDMDTGPQKRRLRFTAAVENISGSIVMSMEQLDIFRTFYRTTIKRGAMRFKMMHPITCELKEFRIKTPPSFAPSGNGLWIVTLDMEALP